MNYLSFKLKIMNHYPLVSIHLAKLKEKGKSLSMATKLQILELELVMKEQIDDMNRKLHAVESARVIEAEELSTKIN